METLKQTYNGFNVNQLTPTLYADLKRIMSYVGNEVLDKLYQGDVELPYNTWFDDYTKTYQTEFLRIIHLGNFFTARFFDDDMFEQTDKMFDNNYTYYKCVFYKNYPERSHIDKVVPLMTFQACFKKLYKDISRYGKKVLYVTQTKCNCTDRHVREVNSNLPMFVFSPVAGRYVCYFMAHRTFAPSAFFSEVYMDNPFVDFRFRSTSYVPHYCLTHNFNERI